MSQNKIIAYLGYDTYADGSINVTDISVVNESEKFVAVRGVELGAEARYPGVWRK
jgi:hypothetical protein